MKKCEWISTSEALPEDFVDVLTVDDLNVFRVLCMYGERWHDDCDISYAPNYVTHWTVLPDTPEKEKKNRN